MIPIAAKAAILEILIRGDGFGLDLIERASEYTEGKLVLLSGNTYPALRALEREGLIERYVDSSSPARGGRQRRMYRITTKGREASAEHRVVVWGLFR